MRAIIRLFVFSVVYSSSAIAAQEQISLVLTEIPFVLSGEPSKQGKYNLIFEQFKRYDAYPNVAAFKPPARAYIEFNQAKVDCIFPVNSSTMIAGKNLIVSDNFGGANAYVYTLAHNPVISDHSQLKQLRLGVRRGFDYGNYGFDSSVVKVEVNSIAQNIEMLNSRRIDAFVAYEPDAIPILEEFSHIAIHRDQQFHIYSQQDKIACHNSAPAQQYLNKVNQALASILQSK